MSDDYIVDAEALAAVLAPYAPARAPERSAATPLPSLGELDLDACTAEAREALPQRLLEFWDEGAVPDGYPSRSEACMAVLVELHGARMTPTRILGAVYNQSPVWQRYVEARGGRERAALALLWSDVSKAGDFERENPRRAATFDDFAALAGDQTTGTAPAPAAGLASSGSHLDDMRKVTPVKRTRKLVHVRELVDPAPIDWLVKGVIEHGTLCMLYGEPAAGKSFVAIDLAVHVARGEPWLGRRTKRGGVVYVAGEGHKGYARRLQASALHHRFELGELPIYITKSAVPFGDHKAAADLIDEILTLCALDDFEPVLIIVDTLRRNFGDGDENSSQDVGRFITSLSALQQFCNSTVVCLHHTGHGNSERERGSSVLIGDFDARYLVSKAGDKPASLVAMKLRDGSLPPPADFAIEQVALGYTDEDGEPITSAVPRWLTGHAPTTFDGFDATPHKPLPGAREGGIALLALDECMRRQHVVAAPEDARAAGSPVVVVKTSVFREIAARRGIDRGETRSSLNNALTRAIRWLTLTDSARMTDDRHYVWLTDVGRARLSAGDDLLA